MSLVHGYLCTNMDKVVGDGRVANHRVVEVSSPYGQIAFDITVWMKAEWANGNLTICDAGLDRMPGVGQPLVTP